MLGRRFFHFGFRPIFRLYIFVSVSRIEFVATLGRQHHKYKGSPFSEQIWLDMTIPGHLTFLQPNNMLNLEMVLMIFSPKQNSKKIHAQNSSKFSTLKNSCYQSHHFETPCRIFKLYLGSTPPTQDASGK